MTMKDVGPITTAASLGKSAAQADT